MTNSILITGSNRGLGLEMVRQYYQDGWNVIACSRDPVHSEELNDLVSQAQSDRLMLLPLNVKNPEDIKNFEKKFKIPPIDILMNNAGVWGPVGTEFGTVEQDPWLDVFKVNTIAPLLLAQVLIEQIANSKLKIIANISSQMGSIADNTGGREYIYRSSKAALNAVTKTMAVDLKNKGITVISLHPGWVKTDMGGQNAAITPTESVNGIKHVLNTISLKDSGSFIKYNGERLSW